MNCKNFVGKRYLVKRDCVIENQYYGKGDIYIPSPQMSEVAFMVLLGKDFFESMPSAPQPNPNAVADAKLALDSLIYYAKRVRVNLDRIYKEDD